MRKNIFLLVISAVILFNSAGFAALTGNHVVNVTLTDVNEITVGAGPIALVLPAVPAAGYGAAAGAAINTSSFNYKHNRATVQNLTVTSVLGTPANWNNVFVQVATTNVGMTGVTNNGPVVLSDGAGVGATNVALLTGIIAGDWTPTLTYTTYHTAGANNSTKSMTVTYTVSNDL